MGLCVQSVSSLLKDKRSSAGLTAASSDTLLLRDVASLMEGAEMKDGQRARGERVKSKMNNLNVKK